MSTPDFQTNRLALLSKQLLGRGLWQYRGITTSMSRF